MPYVYLYQMASLRVFFWYGHIQWWNNTRRDFHVTDEMLQKYNASMYYRPHNANRDNVVMMKVKMMMNFKNLLNCAKILLHKIIVERKLATEIALFLFCYQHLVLYFRFYFLFFLFFLFFFKRCHTLLFFIKKI